MVPQLDGTYNVSDDSDIDSHSYLDLASSNIIVHRMRGQNRDMRQISGHILVSTWLEKRAQSLI